MRIGEVLYFSPNFRFEQLDFGDKDKTIDAFSDRIEGFYLKPARKMASKGHAFACGLLCSASIDFMAKFLLERHKLRGRNRIAVWLEQNINQFKAFDQDNAKRTLAERFVIQFRHGLAHEGRIKELGQFSFERPLNKIIEVYRGAMIVNPELLLENLTNAFEKAIDEVRKDEEKYKELVHRLRQTFSKELKAINVGKRDKA